jgi:signal transduction histidine kinase
MTKENITLTLSADLILKNTPGHIYWKSTNGEYLGCNNELSRTLGLSSPAEIIGKTDFDFFNIKDAQFIRENDERVLTEKKEIYIEEPFYNQSSTKTGNHISKKSPLYDESGKIIGIIGTTLDIPPNVNEFKEKISKTRSQEIPLDSIIALLPGNIYWKDKEGRFLGCNLSQALAVGFESPAMLMGKTAYDTLPHDQADKITAIDNQVMLTGEPITLEEISDQVSTKQSIYLSKKSPLKNHKGEVIGILGVSFDITESKKLEVDLLETKEQMEAAYYIMTEFIANMGHDLTTPISDLSSIAQLLSYYSDEYPELKELFETLTERANACEEVRNSIINATSISNLDFKPETFSIIQELLKLEKKLKPSIGSKNLKLIIYPLKPKKEELIETDRTKFYEILFDLISNAINFTEEGQVTISILKKDGFFHIKITDTGIGIPSDKYDYIFEQYTKLSRSNKYGATFKGVGAGLYLAKIRANILHATISVESEVGKGSTFTLSIPTHLTLKSNN